MTFLLAVINSGYLALIITEVLASSIQLQKISLKTLPAMTVKTADVKLEAEIIQKLKLPRNHQALNQ
jgi:hypothetical protein